ncbi:MAG: UvrD-helicase domain-containing protein [Spirochaetia bacterium]|nr:UvrD-helicase domain-containing protein [Spirochaetia bacterium]
MLADQKNRDEVIAYDGHIFIVAGAGTGKSTIIADKLLWLLESGKLQSIKHVAAITYTNKAAAELKWKIEEKLFQRVDQVKSKEVAETLQKALSLIHESSIGTIHSFCVRLLHKYGYHENIDPLFSIASKEESEVMLHDAFSSYISKTINENTVPGNIWKDLILSGSYNSLGSLFTDVKSIIEKTHLLENLSLQDFPVKNKDDLRRLQESVFNEHVMRFNEYLSCYNYSEEASANIDSLGGKLDTLNRVLRHEDNPLQRIKLYNLDIYPESYRGKKKYILDSSPHENIQKILKEYLILFSKYPFNEDHSVNEEVRQHFKSTVLPQYSGITNNTLKNEYHRYLFFKGLSDFHNYFMEFKRQKSVLSYNDIIFYTNKLLNNKNILMQVQKQYHYIFVDEYQDTDPLQTSIFIKMADTIYANKSKELSSEKQSLKLIRVGDAKQSIYSFRGADLETFHHEKEKFHFHDSGYIGHLTVNMRSHPRIIKFINRVFTPMTNNTSMDIENYESIIPGTQNSRLPDPGVYINYFKSSDENDSKQIKVKRKLEATWLASEIETLFALDKKLSVCILFLSMKDNLEPYVAQLKEKNIPFSLIGRRYYGENFTKRYLIFFCKYLYNTSDNISLTGFLRCPVVGFTDIEVENVINSDYIRRAIQNEIVHEKNMNSELLLKVEKIVELFNTCILLSRNQSLPDMIFYLLDHSNFLPFTNLLYNSEIIKESIDRFLEIAVSTENISFLTFNEKFSHFIEEIEKLENIPEVDESVEAYSHQNSVQIMSYHKSKGLEFDVVFMPDLASIKNNRSEELVLESSIDPAVNSDDSQFKQLNVVFQYKGDLSSCSVNGNKIETTLKRKKKEEMVRLAYVAMTRAKERLYLPIHGNLKDGDCLLKYFNEALSEKFQVNNETKDQHEEWLPVEYDSAMDSIYYQRYHCTSVKDENNEDEYSELVISKASPAIPRFENNPSASYSFVSGTSIMKKLAAQKGIRYDKSNEKSSEIHFEESLINSDQENMDEIQIGDFYNQQNILEDALTRGVIAHSVFELINLKNPEIHEEVLQVLFYTHAFNFQAQKSIEKYATELMGTYKKSTLFNLVLSSQIIGKEIPFSQLFLNDKNFSFIDESYKNQKQIAVGYIDLILKDAENSIHIIDYKTNVKPEHMSFSDFSKHLLETYEIPMMLYKSAIENVFPDSHVVLTLYHTPSGESFSYQNL